MERLNVMIGNPLEEVVGFSRAVRVGPWIAVGGTAPVGPEGETVGVGDVSAQARRCFEIIGEALNAAGAGFEHVVRTRLLLTSIDDFEAVAAVRREYVGRYRPVDTIVEVTGFKNPEWMIEVEADAIVS